MEGDKIKSYAVIQGYIRRSGAEWPLWSPVEFKAATAKDLRYLMDFHRVSGDVMEVVEIEYAEGVEPETDN